MSPMVSAIPTAADRPLGPARGVGRWVRVNARNLVIAAFVGVGSLLFARQVGSIVPALHAIAHANPIGLLAVMVFGASTYFAAAVALRAASGLPLALGHATNVQLAAAATNRVVPAGIGGMVTNARYLEREGSSRGQAAAAIGLTSFTSFIVHVVVTALAVAVASSGGTIVSFGLPALPLSMPFVVGAIAVLAVVIGLVVVSRWRVAASALVTGLASVRELRRHPSRLAMLVLGSLGVTMGHAFAFVAAAHACGVHLGVGALLAVFLGGSAIGNASPTPGGVGAIEAVMVAGLTGLGAVAAPALAAVLTFRLITYWLPVLPGVVALRTVVDRRVPEPERPVVLAAA